MERVQLQTWMSFAFVLGVLLHMWQPTRAIYVAGGSFAGYTISEIIKWALRRRNLRR